PVAVILSCVTAHYQRVGLAGGCCTSVPGWAGTRTICGCVGGTTATGADGATVGWPVNTNRPIIISVPINPAPPSSAPHAEATPDLLAVFSYDAFSRGPIRAVSSVICFISPSYS